MNVPVEELKVDYASIEKSLAELWRGEKGEGEHAVTRAALWNVVAHTAKRDHQTFASEILGRASASVPQRTIVIRAEPDAEPDITSWISANCHLLNGEKQVCSEEVAIVAGGDRVDRVPPLVNALLIPDMPVAVWWVGDLPSENASYVESLLEPADRLIVDSSFFDSPDDMELVSRVARQTTTAPADLNWVRLEEWRVATAMLFDPPAIRARLRRIHALKIIACSTAGKPFGDSAESLLFAAWLSAQGEHEPIEYQLRTEQRDSDHGSLCQVEIEFDDQTVATLVRDEEKRVIVANYDGVRQTVDCVTRTLSRGVADLVVRMLKRPEADKVYIRALPIAVRLARTIAA